MGLPQFSITVHVQMVCKSIDLAQILLLTPNHIHVSTQQSPERVTGTSGLPCVTQRATWASPDMGLLLSQAMEIFFFLFCFFFTQLGNSKLSILAHRPSLTHRTGETATCQLSAWDRHDQGGQRRLEECDPDPGVLEGIRRSPSPTPHRGRWAEKTSEVLLMYNLYVDTSPALIGLSETKVAAANAYRTVICTSHPLNKIPNGTGVP